MSGSERNTRLTSRLYRKRRDHPPGELELLELLVWELIGSSLTLPPPSNSFFFSLLAWVVPAGTDSRFGDWETDREQKPTICINITERADERLSSSPDVASSREQWMAT